MPCIPDWEDRMVLEAKTANIRLNELYPELKKRAEELLLLMQKFNLELSNPLELVTEMPVMPPVPSGLASEEEAKEMSEYSEIANAVISDLELWLCKNSTTLVIGLDKMNWLSDSEDGMKIIEIVNEHKKHREEDRNEAAKKLRQQISWYIMAISLEKHESDQQKLTFLEGKRLLEEKLSKLMSYTTDELIRDRMLTNI